MAEQVKSVVKNYLKQKQQQKKRKDVVKGQNPVRPERTLRTNKKLYPQNAIDRKEKAKELIADEIFTRLLITESFFFFF